MSGRPAHSKVAHPALSGGAGVGAGVAAGAFPPAAGGASAQGCVPRGAGGGGSTPLGPEPVLEDKRDRKPVPGLAALSSFFLTSNLWGSGRVSGRASAALRRGVPMPAERRAAAPPRRSPRPRLPPSPRRSISQRDVTASQSAPHRGASSQGQILRLVQGGGLGQRLGSGGRPVAGRADLLQRLCPLQLLLVVALRPGRRGMPRSRAGQACTLCGSVCLPSSAGSVPPVWVGFWQPIDLGSLPNLLPHMASPFPPSSPAPPKSQKRWAAPQS